MSGVRHAAFSQHSSEPQPTCTVSKCAPPEFRLHMLQKLDHPPPAHPFHSRHFPHHIRYGLVVCLSPSRQLAPVEPFM